jgi:hypothetical protein
MAGTGKSSQERKFVVFNRRRFVIANSRPIPVRALAIIYSESVNFDRSHQSMPHRNMWLNCLWDDRRFVRHLGNVSLSLGS